MSAERTITLRLTIQDPFPGVAYSLQDKKSRPVGPVVAGTGPFSFDVPVRIAPGPRFLGEFVRAEGPTRRFVYIAIGRQAGGHSLEWNRRAKIDINTLPDDLLDQVTDGKVLEAVLPGKARDGGPACATVRPLQAWRIVDASPA